VAKNACMKNLFFTILISIIFAAMLIGTIYFGFKANKIGWKYRYKSPDIMDELSAQEKILVKKYLRKSRLYFFGGILIIVLLYFVYGIGGYFEK